MRSLTGSFSAAPAGKTGTVPAAPLVFLSSATTDLADLRVFLEAFLRQKGIGVENFQTSPKAWKTIRDRLVEDIERAQVLVLLLGKHYGSPSEPDPTVSWTHFEWREARRRDKPVLHFLHAPHPMTRTTPAPATGEGAAEEPPPTCCEARQAEFVSEIAQSPGAVNFLRLVPEPDLMGAHVFSNLYDYFTAVPIERVAPTIEGPSRRSARRIIAAGAATIVALSAVVAVLAWNGVLAREEVRIILAAAASLTTMIGAWFMYRMRPRQ